MAGRVQPVRTGGPVRQKNPPQQARGPYGQTQRAASGQGTRRINDQPPRDAGGQPPGKKKVRHFYDYSLLFCIIFLTAFGLVMIYSASSYMAQLNPKLNGNGAYYMQRQAMIAAVGFFGMLVVSKIDYHFYARFAAAAYLLSYVLMIAVSLVGIERNGKKRWLGIGSLSFQPTEFAKIALIVFLAVLITRYGPKINKWKYMGYVAAFTLPIAGIVAANNLSSGIIICGIAFVMLFVACKVKWPFFGIGALGIGVLAGAGPIGKFLLQIKLLQPYQFRRIEAWLNPESDPTDKGFQVLQGLYAIGSGGLVGQGLGESIQKLGFLPESQNDMIFAIICEELGLFGAVSIILIFLFMIYRFMLIANNAPDLLGALLVVGVMGHIAIQVILNIAVVTNTIPNTGITLPFISYGGTSVLFLMLEMGIVLSVSNRIRLEK
ncbi:MAG: FtsW/RodA/SpoVE family cell cycle protein [Enterocloster sp.]